MIKLTLTHLEILTAASCRSDGFAIRPEKLKSLGAAKVATRLIEQGLVRELRAKAEMPIWREDENGKAFSLKILKAGRSAVASASRADEAVASVKVAALPFEIGMPAGQAEFQGSSLAEGGSKRGLVLAMMQRQQGATIDDLMSVTGWLPHTTRAALSGLRKKGVSIVRSRNPNDQHSVYKISALVTAAAA